MRGGHRLNAGDAEADRLVREPLQLRDDRVIARRLGVRAIVNPQLLLIEPAVRSAAELRSALCPAKLRSATGFDGVAASSAARVRLSSSVAGTVALIHVPGAAATTA